LIAGVAIGVAVGYAMPTPKPVDLPPGSRYVLTEGQSSREDSAVIRRLGACRFVRCRLDTAKDGGPGHLPILVMMPMARPRMPPWV